MWLLWEEIGVFNTCTLPDIKKLPDNWMYVLFGLFFTLEKIEKMLKCHKNITNDVQVVKLKK